MANLFDTLAKIVLKIIGFKFKVVLEQEVLRVHQMVDVIHHGHAGGQHQRNLQDLHPAQSRDRQDNHNYLHQAHPALSILHFPGILVMRLIRCLLEFIRNKLQVYDHFLQIVIIISNISKQLIAHGEV